MLYTLKEILRIGGKYYNSNIVTVTKGHTTNWYREIDDDQWENYNCTSSY